MFYWPGFDLYFLSAGFSFCRWRPSCAGGGAAGGSNGVGFVTALAAFGLEQGFFSLYLLDVMTVVYCIILFYSLNI